MCEKTNIRPPSKVTMKIEWIPYTYADHDHGHAADEKKHKHHKCAVSLDGRVLKGRSPKKAVLRMCVRASSAVVRIA